MCVKTVNSASTSDVLTANAWMFTTAGTGNWAHNIRGNSSTALNSILGIGQATVVTVFAALGSSAGYGTTVQIDGVNQTIQWSGGTAPSAAGGTSGFDIYSYTIVKRANATFTTFGSFSRFG